MRIRLRRPRNDRERFYQMEKDKNVWEIPYGMRDYLPDEAAAKRALETKLARLFLDWGYDEVVTPTVEYMDNLTRGSSHSLEPHLFRLIDRHNRTVALRHEMTTPIARLVSSRLQDQPLPVKLSYISSVFRYEEAQAGRQCEFYQAGVELMGTTSAQADAEVIALAIESLRQSGLSDFQVCVGQVDFINAILAQYNIDDDTQSAIRAALEKRNLVALGQLVDALKLPDNAKEVLRNLPLLNGGAELLDRAYTMALNERSRRALDNLSEVYRLLKAYGVTEYVRFDLGIIRDFSYYTGLVFEIYAPGLGFPIAGGGRYDHLLSDFGAACPATGFAVGIERILMAQQCQQLPHYSPARDIYVGYAAARGAEAIERARELRSEGRVVELAMMPESREMAERSQQQRGYAELVYLA